MQNASNAIKTHKFETRCHQYKDRGNELYIPLYTKMRECWGNCNTRTCTYVYVQIRAAQLAQLSVSIQHSKQYIHITILVDGMRCYSELNIQWWWCRVLLYTSGYGTIPGGDQPCRQTRTKCQLEAREMRTYTRSVVTWSALPIRSFNSAHKLSLYSPLPY